MMNTKDRGTSDKNSIWSEVSSKVIDAISETSKYEKIQIDVLNLFIKF